MQYAAIVIESSLQFQSIWNRTLVCIFQDIRECRKNLGFQPVHNTLPHHFTLLHLPYRYYLLYVLYFEHPVEDLSRIIIRHLRFWWYSKVCKTITYKLIEILIDVIQFTPDKILQSLQMHAQLLDMASTPSNPSLKTRLCGKDIYFRGLHKSLNRIHFTHVLMQVSFEEGQSFLLLKTNSFFHVMHLCFFLVGHLLQHCCFLFQSVYLNEKLSCMAMNTVFSIFGIPHF